MPENVNTSANVDFDGRPQEYNPRNDAPMRPIIVQDEPVPGLKVKFPGYKTDVQGASVPLDVVSKHNQERRRISPSGSRLYDTIYFTTESGTIYRAQNLKDGSWDIERTSNSIHTGITQPCTIEVGQRFISPNLIGGQPDLNTSPVREITVVDTNGKAISTGIHLSQEQTDIGEQFHRAVRTRGS